MKPILKLLLPATLLFFTIAAAAQTKQPADTTTTDSVATVKKNVLNASVNYVSRLNYFGRVDSLKSSGLFPVVGIDSKIGLYATGTFIFTQNSAQPLTYAGTAIEAGYKFPENKHFAGNIFYSQFLYKNSAAIVQSALKEQTGINATWKNKYVNVTGGMDLKFSNNTDIGVTGALDHLFIFRLTGIKKSAIALNPTATVNAGSQKFVQSYSTKTGGILGNLPGSASTTTQNVDKFNILSYEFSMPVVFVINKFYAALTPAYVLPENLITVKNRPDLTETGSNMFYVTATIGMRLEFR
ncbi:MAG TPA: hypothetical protein VG738_01715 [Chitinophagaceae bacterium]|nr:hypothetical protein [Chitinophagaceae bacterium]